MGPGGPALLELTCRLVLQSLAMRTLIAAVATLLAATSAFAAAPDVNTIVSKMKTALEPARPSFRKLEFVISAHYGGGPEQTSWTAGQLRKAVGGQNQMLTVMLAPWLRAEEKNPLQDARALADVLVVISNGRVALNRLPFAK